MRTALAFPALPQLPHIFDTFFTTKPADVITFNTAREFLRANRPDVVHAKHDAAKNGRTAEADAYTAQIESIEQRAELIRRCFLLALISLAGTIASCLLLGLGLYWPQAALMAVVVFVLAMICLFAGACYYLSEVNVALSSVRDEARDARFMDIVVDVRGSHHV